MYSSSKRRLGKSQSDQHGDMIIYLCVPTKHTRKQKRDRGSYNTFPVKKFGLYQGFLWHLLKDFNMIQASTKGSLTRLKMTANVQSDRITEIINFVLPSW